MHSIETKEKMRLAHLGRRYKPMSQEGRRNISLAKMGKSLSPAHIANVVKARKGYKHSLETRAKISKSARKGAESNLWRGGISPANELIRKTSEYKLWREAVFTRDNWICVACLQRGNELHADHIKPFAYFPELRFAIDNGRTLCVSCHRETDTWGVRNKKT